MALERPRILTPLSRKELAFQIGDTVMFGSRGVYRIDNVELMSLGERRQKFYSLVQVFSKTIHRTLVGEGSKDMATVRMAITAHEFFTLGEALENLEIVPLEFGWNSNKKLNDYGEWIQQGGFLGLVRAFLATTVDCNQNPKVDKRIKAFNFKLRIVIIEEVANALGIDLIEAEEKLKNIFFNLFN